MSFIFLSAVVSSSLLARLVCLPLPVHPFLSPSSPPRFSEIRRGISNTAGTLSGVIGVAATGRILQAAGGADAAAGWQRAFLLAAVQCVLGSLVFLTCARGERLFGADTTDFQ